MRVRMIGGSALKALLFCSLVLVGTSEASRRSRRCCPPAPCATSQASPCSPCAMLQHPADSHPVIPCTCPIWELGPTEEDPSQSYFYAEYNGLGSNCNNPSGTWVIADPSTIVCPQFCQDCTLNLLGTQTQNTAFKTLHWNPDSMRKPWFDYSMIRHADIPLTFTDPRGQVHYAYGQILSVKPSQIPGATLPRRPGANRDRDIAFGFELKVGEVLSNPQVATYLGQDAYRQGCLVKSFDTTFLIKLR